MYTIFIDQSYLNKNSSTKGGKKIKKRQWIPKTNWPLSKQII